MGYVIFGDIHGQLEQVLSIMEKAPAGYKPVSVGDMIDRGPSSRQVVDYFMRNGLAVRGNHDEMMLAHYRPGAVKGKSVTAPWHLNGGVQTMESYKGYDDQLQEHLDWIEQLPYKLELDQLWITHSGDAGNTWTRQAPGYTPSKIKVFGHDGREGPEVNFKTISGRQIPYSIALDTWPVGYMSALVWPDFYFICQYYAGNVPAVEEKKE